MQKDFMKISGVVAILLGCIFVIDAVSTSSPYAIESSINGLSQVIGGGLFIALGISIFVLNRSRS